LAQNPITIKSPKPDSTVHNGEIFVVCSVDPRIKFLPESVKFMIEGAEISPLIKINANIITILITNEIRPDIYTAEIQLRSETGKLYRQSWSFFVDIYKTEEINRVKEQKKTNSEKLSFKGIADLSFRFTKLDGSGISLRQEPPQMHDIRINGNFRINHYKIPLKIYFSNHENELLPFRNRFMTGFESEYLRTYFGDVNPDYNRLVLSGTSIRGYEIYWKRRSTEMSFVRGHVNRAIEGRKEKYLEGTGFPPFNMLADSTYFIEGIYKRKISAFNIIFNAIDGTKFNMTFLKSTDDSNSITYGGMVAQNFVFGAGNQVKFNNNRFYANMQVALSATTFDIRRGVYSKPQIDEIFGSDIPFRPEDYSWLLIFNGTTVPLSWKNKPPLAFWGDARLNILQQKFIFKYQRLGSSFYSFGNPFLVNDRRIMTAEDRIELFKKKLKFRLQYSYLTNNLSKNLALRKITHIASFSMNLKIKPNLPSLEGSYRFYNRINRLTDTNIIISNTYLHSLTTGSSWTFKTGILEHIIQASYNLYYRVQENSNTASHSINFYLNENIKSLLLLTAYSNSFIMTNDSANLGIINTLGGRITLKFFKEKVRLSAGLNYTINEASDLISASSRFHQDAEMSIHLIKNLTISATYGKGVYQEPDFSINNYNEKFALFKLNYLF